MSNLFYQDLQDKSDGSYEQKIRQDAIQEFADGLCCHSCFTNLQKDAIKKFAEELKNE